MTLMPTSAAMVPHQCRDENGDCGTGDAVATRTYVVSAANAAMCPSYTRVRPRTHAPVHACSGRCRGTCGTQRLEPV